MPFVYLPKEIFKWFYKELLDQYNNLPGLDEQNKMVCDSVKECIIEQPCDEVRQFLKEKRHKIAIKLSLKDPDKKGGDSVEIVIEDDMLFVPGE